MYDVNISSFSSVQLLSHVWLCDPMDCSMPGLRQSPTPGVYSNSCPLSQWYYPRISSSVVPFSSCLQSFPASVFSNKSVLRIRWPKYWSFSFNIRPSNKYSLLISFRMHRMDLLAVQGTLKGLLQHQSSKASRIEFISSLLLKNVIVLFIFSAFINILLCF